jgi:peptidoglycan/xylan/chitin deacetylase (PgdA/CDA1 family)
MRHFEVVSPADVGEAMRAPRGRRVALTFDDGYRDSHDVALPVLRAHGVPAGFFPITGFVDRPRVPWWDEIAWMVRTSPRASVAAGPWLEAPLPLGDGDREPAVRALLGRYRSVPGGESEGFLDFLAEATGSGRHPPGGASELWLTWDMVRALHAAGMTIGGHTASHPLLPTLSPEGQREEIASCRRRIEAEVGAPMKVFAHPAGRFDAHTRACLAHEGVELAFAHSGGYARRRGKWDPYAVPRTSVSRRVDARRLVGTLTLPRLFARW